MLRRPSMQDLSAPLAQVARTIAAKLGARGHRTWIVGGAVRDLALGRAIQDVDLASAATPDEIEALFERTVPLGRGFGTVLIHLDGHDVEHTTFRSEGTYSDGRRPDAVAFGKTPEEDATRRDFTCNALYLDPLEGTLLDPTGGIADLEAGRLACVGDPKLRFAEDGLRIVRLARFAGQLGLEPTSETRAAAQSSLDALRGVSRERVRVELERLLERGGILRALAILVETGAIERILSGFGPDALERARATLARVGEPPGLNLGWAALFGPGPTGALDGAISLLESLKPSRGTRDHVADAWRLAQQMSSAGPVARSTRVRWARRPAFGDARLLARAWAGSGESGTLHELAAERERLFAEGRAAPLLTSADLVERGLKPGPDFGVILREAETRQLDGQLTSRAAALAWLDARAVRSGSDAKGNE